MADKGTAIVIKLSITYRTYCELRDQGDLARAVDGLRCGRDGCGHAVVLANRRVRRGVCWLHGLRFLYEQLSLELSRCTRPEGSHWHRVLPCEIQPYKLFATSGQEAVCRSYFGGDQGLRRVVGQFEGDRPHFTSLHGWLGGMGDYARGRRQPADALPVGAARAEAERRLGTAESKRVWQAEPPISRERYRSSVRLGELVAAFRLLAAAVVVVKAPFPLTEWSRLILSWDHVTTIGWFARSTQTAFQHGVPASDPVDSSSVVLPLPKEEEPWPNRTRSPPGDTSR